MHIVKRSFLIFTATGTCSISKRRQQPRLGRIPYQKQGEQITHDVSSINNLTIGDLQKALNTEYPVSLKAKGSATAPIAEASTADSNRLTDSDLMI